MVVDREPEGCYHMSMASRQPSKKVILSLPHGTLEALREIRWEKRYETLQDVIYDSIYQFLKREADESLSGSAVEGKPEGI